MRIGTRGVIATAIVGLVLVVAAAITIAALRSANTHAGPQSSNDSIQDADKLDASIRDMYASVLSGNFEQAYSYRSHRCKMRLSESDYVASMTDLMNGVVISETQAKDAIAYTLLPADSSSEALVEVRLKVDDPSFPQEAFGGAARKWSVEKGRWMFDNCE